MNADQLRQRFLSFFERQGHRRIPSSSLVPDNDPSLLFTTAGMQQLKPFFLGERDVEKVYGTRRLTSVQRCFRTSDIDEVGDATHNTFFEMLGNFSVGDYFKAEAIALAWQFLTEELRLPSERLWATVFAGDDHNPADREAVKLWQRYLPADRICAFGREDNFWGPSGDTGPCGPSSEVHIDRSGKPCGRGTACRPNCSCGRFLELWNLVFMEFVKRSNGQFAPLKAKNIDTGMGLERLALILQSKETIFETDVLRPILESLNALEPNGQAGSGARERRLRIAGDHLRAAYFLIADGVEFSNKDQGYILRRIVRRALDQFTVAAPDLQPVVRAIRDVYATAYPDVAGKADAVCNALQREVVAYHHLLKIEVDRVLQKLRRATTERDVSAPSSRQLTPQEAFTLYSTHGISPSRLEREGFTYDRPAFEALVAQHQSTSRSGSAKKFGGHGLGHGVGTGGYSPADIWKITRLHTATHLLHAALRATLGSSVRQNGSDINPERLRFDFFFPRKLTADEKNKVEALVNEKVHDDLAVRSEELTYADALRQGALAFFKEKYTDRVTVYTIGDFSKELCGGPHVEHTKQVGGLKIISEKSSAAGIRRIKAVVLDEG